jgi:hypothetical protein
MLSKHSTTKLLFPDLAFIFEKYDCYLGLAAGRRSVVFEKMGEDLGSIYVM